ncbi:ABC transporter substrate-binding protein [Puniceibacterium sediminis]|uniref:Amino acid/amide ABC transporter substrate-binding protein, HAAT family n=1 Tax=Puniceibacterium sediminis TaxID=1608407 RepID=A0A238X7T8_9RHOB|nr:ABC transporter substrate-binding protein [Puniceibacterium sediminis]SNR54404.1 amino acid/amide ABC transporter substrate-binding protein, HAAT family [Puniceibacterium sediminis]
MTYQKRPAPKQPGTTLSRRRALLLATGTLAAATLGAPALVRAQSGPIRIGHLTPMTGFLGTLGGWAVEGASLAAEEINAAGGINGRMIELMSEDSINPENGATKAQRMLERDGADFILGEISSATSLAISEVAARNEKLFIAVGPRSDVLRGDRCSKYMFCTDIPNTVMVNAVGTALKQEEDIAGKKFFTLTADYVFGHDLLVAAKNFFDVNNAELIGDELIATDVTDFSPFILKIRQANPDIVCLNLAGNQVTNFVKQYAEFGLPYPMVGFNLNTADAWAAGAGNLTGTWPTVWLHTLDTPDSKSFVQRFQTKYDKIPENHAWISYIAMQIAAKGMSETGGAATPDLIEYFESGAEFDIMKNRPAYFRAEDHQLVQEAYAFKVKDEGTYDDVHDMLELTGPVPASDEPLESIYPSTEGGACKI